MSSIAPSIKRRLSWLASLSMICLACLFCALWLLPEIDEFSEGDPIPLSGSLKNQGIAPSLSDSEYYQLALQIVGKLRWESDDVTLGSLGRTMDCDTEEPALHIWVTLHRWRRIGLRWAGDTGFVNLYPTQNKGDYYLAESQGGAGDSIFHPEGFDIGSLQFDSGQAYNIAEEYGGQAFRESINNECWMGVGYDRDATRPSWLVHYVARLQTTEDTRADVDYRVDAATGEVELIQTSASNGK